MSPAALRISIIPEPVGEDADPPSYDNDGIRPVTMVSWNATEGGPASPPPLLYSPMLPISHIDYGPPHLAK